MRAVIQRVSEASVTIQSIVHSQIQTGLLILLAVEASDSPEESQWLAKKIVQLRIFNDEGGVMNRSVQDIGGQILVVSQFTLFASTSKGNRPSYSRAAGRELSIPLYEGFLQHLEAAFGIPILSGQFGAEMKVCLINDGPVTVIIDSKLKE